MAWTNASSSSTFNASSASASIMEGRGARDLTAGSGLFDGISMAFGGSASRSDYSIIGIKASQVEPMRAAIRTYVANIQSYLEDAIMNAEANMDTAFRGSALQDEVKTYLKKVKDYCNNLTSTLLAFSDKLADVSNAWLAATQAMSSNVSDATGAFSAGSAYKDNMTATSR